MDAAWERDTDYEHLKSLGEAGEYFRQVDLAKELIQRYSDDWRFKHLYLLSLANAGATDYAIELYKEYGLQSVDEIDARTIYARLLKDRAFTASDKVKRKALLLEAASVYESAREIPGTKNAYYPEDNAAQLYLLAGDHVRAQALASNVLVMLDVLSCEGENDAWALASRVNALVILKRFEEAKNLIPELVNSFDGNWSGAATTIRHLEMLLAELEGPAEWIDILRPPKIAVFTGHIISSPDEAGRFPAPWEGRVTQDIRIALSKEPIGHGYGALAAGADIIFAETLLEMEAGFTIVLPCAENNFIEESVARSGRTWVERYHAIRNRPDVEVIFATTEPLMGDDSMFSYGARLAMGLAVLRAQHLQTDVEQFALWDGMTARGGAGTAIDIAIWADQMLSDDNRKQTIIPLSGDGASATDATPCETEKTDFDANHRTARAMLFGDFAGFSKLKDSQIPSYINNVLGIASEVLSKHAGKILFQNTWGDGLFIVTKRAHEAAAIALDMQAAVMNIHMEITDIPQTLKFRMGGHLGPVFQRADPVLSRDNFFGSQVSHAARIEPIAPPGAIYVSAQFAAALALQKASDFKCEVVGTTELAKNYGSSRIFLLRRIEK